MPGRGKPIKKGQVLNPSGRGKGVNGARSELYEACYDIAKEMNLTNEHGEPDGHAVRVLIQKEMVKGALSQDDPRTQLSFIKEANDRMFGKAPQDVTTNGESIQQTPLALIQALNKKD